MIDFEAALRGALNEQGKKSAAFQTAEEDLRRLVLQASAAIGKVSDGLLSLRMERVEDTPARRTFGLSLEVSGESRPHLFTVGISAEGYPLVVGDLQPFGTGTKFTSVGSLANRAALEEWFSDLLSRADSSLVVQLAFHLRKADTVSGG